MAVDVDSILSDLKNNKYSPVYFLQGDEPFFIDQVSDYIEKNALDEAAKGFNQMVMYGKDVSINDVISNARRFPMMSERQVVIVKEAQNIKDINKEEGSKRLLEYIENPLPSTILVMCHKYKKIDQRKKLGKEIAKRSVFLNTKRMYDNQLPDWIKKYVYSIGYKINDEAVHLINNFIGNNLERISNELKKILINFKDENEIASEHVYRYIGVSKEYNVFELTKALANKNAVKANSIINYFAANPKDNSVIGVIAVLYLFFSRLMHVYYMDNKSEGNIASAFKIPFTAGRDFKIALNHYDLRKLESVISDLRNADMQAKGISASSLDEGQILKELIFRILH